MDNFIEINFAPLAGLLFLLIFQLSDKEMEKGICHGFYALSLLELAEMVCYSLELWTASFTEPTLWRTLFSALGYSIRPFIIFGVFHLTVYHRLPAKKLVLFSIPAFLNMIAAFSAFFTGIVYSYNDCNEFVRGPLGYITHLIIALYILDIIFFSRKKEEKRNTLESFIIWGSSAVIIFAMVMEAVFKLHCLGRTAIVLSTIAFYMFFQTRVYREDIQGFMEQKISSQKEHLRELSIIGVLANEYVTVCYVDVAQDLVTPYRMDSAIEEKYGDIMRAGVTFEQVYQSYVMNDICEEDRDFFLNLADLESMLAYLRQNGSLSRKYRVYRNGSVLYCEMRVELVMLKDGTEDMVFGFSNHDTRVRREMVYQSTVRQELDKVEAARNSLAGIAELAEKLRKEIEENLSNL